MAQHPNDGAHGKTNGGQRGIQGETPGRRCTAPCLRIPGSVTA